jgi:Arc/MetJ-type ribon-helix-helix transcriptional regulator
MSAITIPLTPDLDLFINNQIKHGFIKSKAELVRQALNNYREDLEVREIMQAREEYKKGLYFKGDLREIAKNFK